MFGTCNVNGVECALAMVLEEPTNTIEIIQSFLGECVVGSMKYRHKLSTLLSHQTPDTSPLLLEFASGAFDREGELMTSQMYKQLIGLMDECSLDVNIRGKHLRTALMLACISDRTDLVTLLLNNGANIHARDASGDTALSIACSYNNLELTKLICSHLIGMSREDAVCALCGPLRLKDGITPYYRTESMLVKRVLQKTLGDDSGQIDELFSPRTQRLMNYSMFYQTLARPSLLHRNEEVRIDLVPYTSTDINELQNKAWFCDIHGNAPWTGGSNWLHDDSWNLWFSPSFTVDGLSNRLKGVLPWMIIHTEMCPDDHHCQAHHSTIGVVYSYPGLMRGDNWRIKMVPEVPNTSVLEQCTLQITELASTFMKGHMSSQYDQLEMNVVNKRPLTHHSTEHGRRKWARIKSHNFFRGDIVLNTETSPP